MAPLFAELSCIPVFGLLPWDKKSVGLPNNTFIDQLRWNQSCWYVIKKMAEKHRDNLFHECHSCPSYVSFFLLCELLNLNRPLLVGFSSCRKPHVRAIKKWCTLIRKSNLTPSFCKHNVNLISFSPLRFFFSLFLLCGLRTSRWTIPKLFFRAHPLLCSSVVSITDSQLCIWGSNPTENLNFMEFWVFCE